jgi:hypothetical protein
MIRNVTAELVETREKIDTKGRKIADEARRRDVLAEYAKSGLTQTAFAKAEGIKYSSLVRWLGLSRRGQVAAPKPPVRFAELRLGARAPGLEVGLPSGIVIRGADVAQIAAMIKALGR